jgi:hypothetical protein
MKSKHKAQRVAEWMLKELKRLGKLHQDTAVYEIAEKFGSRSTTYDNKDGNLAIRIDILAAFRELTKDSVVWVQEDRYWRMRTPGDEPGRHQTHTPMSNESFELGFESCGHTTKVSLQQCERRKMLRVPSGAASCSSARKVSGLCQRGEIQE